MRKIVVIVKSALEEFRVPFYTKLASALSNDNVDLQIVVPADTLKRPGLLPQNTPPHLFVGVPLRMFRWGVRQLNYQKLGRSLEGAALVIVQQSASDLTTYLLFAGRRWKGYRLAFWGHGKNFQGSLRNRSAELFKIYLSKRVDHWFAYNDASADVVKQLPFPAERICVVNNSIDTEAARAEWNSISARESEELREKLGIRDGEPVVVYCGSLYRAKMLQFLLDSVALARREQPLHLIVIGDGPDRAILVDFEKHNSDWVHYAGTRHGREKAMYFKLASLCLIPGAVGLAIVDAMAYETPLLTTHSDDHGPEIAYLEHGRNGWITECDVDDYAEAISRFLSDTNGRMAMVEGCQRTASHITLANMVERFRRGVVSALNQTPRSDSSRIELPLKQFPRTELKSLPLCESLSIRETVHTHERSNKSTRRSTNQALL